MKTFSRRTKLVNRTTATIVVRARRNTFIIKDFNVAIEPGKEAYVYYSNLRMEFNYSEPNVEAFLDSQEVGTKKYVNTSVVRDNEVIVFSFENGKISFEPIKGKFLARIAMCKWFVSPTSVPVQPLSEVGGEDAV